MEGTSRTCGCCNPSTISEDSPARQPVRWRNGHHRSRHGWKLAVVPLIAGIFLAGCGNGTTGPPADCTAAIEDARAIALTVNGALGAAAGYPKLVPRAAVAGATGNSAELDAVARRMRRLNARVERANQRIAGQVESFNAHAAGCQ